DNIFSGLPPFSAITPDEPVLSTEEPDNSLSMADEHLDTIPTTESDEFIKAGVENLIPIPKKIVSKPLCEEEIIPMKLDQHPDNVESDPMKSLSTYDSSLSISSKIDSLLDEFAGELTHLKSIPPEIDETDCDFEEDFCLIEKLLYDNFSPRPPEEFVSANSDAKIKSFSPSPILVKDSDFLMEEIDLFCTLDYPIPPDIEDKDYDSERDILIPKDLPRNNTISFAEKESFHF
nr:hypothetical protein [Tanacetum cinerariifolium]GFA73433.1 hypothetical protein [Tanacetum cinerariifolium]